MEQTIKFNKSLQQRLNEYENVLSGNGPFPPTRIRREWSFYMELVLDPVGWQAIWKIDRRTCEHFGIQFPTIVLVVVLSVNYAELTALVKILAVQDEDIHLPAKHHVALIHLHPTNEQDTSVALNIDRTADILDMLRFFYDRLFMPWDDQLDDFSDWKSDHLESRLRLQYDIINGSIPEVLARHLQALVSEAKNLVVKREQLEDDFNEDIEDQAVELALAQLHMRMLNIKSEVEMMEVPIFRQVILSKFTTENQAPKECENSTVWLVSSHGTVNQYAQFVKYVENDYPMHSCKVAQTIQTALEQGQTNDIFVLGQDTEHLVAMTGALELGGVLKGICREKTMLTCNIDRVMLDFQGDVRLENLTINAAIPQYAIVVRKGTLCMKNCTLVGDGKSSVHQGIIVLAGASLELIDCDISKFNAGIVGNSDSSITISNSTIHDCNYGLKIFIDCAVKASDTKIGNCKLYGICLENETAQENQRQVGNFEILNIVPKIKLQATVGDNNGKGDAVINKKERLAPVCDLFQNPETDPTFNGGDEMECANSPVERLSPVTI